MDADSLLRGASGLLGCPPGAEIDNWALAQSFAAAEVPGILICKELQRAPVPAPVEAPADTASAATELNAAAASLLDQLAADPTALPVAAQPEQADQRDEAAAVGGAEARNAVLAAATPKLHVCVPGAVPAQLQGCPALYMTHRAGGQAGGEPLCTLLPMGPSLANLHLLLTRVLAPLVEPQQSAHAAQAEGEMGPEAAAAVPSKEAAGDSSRAGSGAQGGSSADWPEAAAELLAATHKFAAQVAACAKHLNSEVAVQLPAVNLHDADTAARSEEAVLACESCMEEWVCLAMAALQREAALQPTGRGPLAELEFWQAREGTFSRLLDQLSVPAVRTAQEVVESASLDRNLAASFRAQLSELTRLTQEARDNSRFLHTMERHFRTLSSGGLHSIVDALQPMLNALRMIWVVSRYFGDDVHMSNLLERIANGLQDRLDGALDMATLFQVPAAQSLELVRACQAVAEGWLAQYMATRENIEMSGHPARWEFSKQLLFESTNHAAEVCRELAGMVQAADDFRLFLGPELKAVTGDTSVIDEVSVMVQAMVEPVEGVRFNPLAHAHAEDWRAVGARFASDADDIKLATRDLIDTCFRKLRSVDAAAQLLHSFQRIQAQGAMQRQMSDKLAAVLEHFLREIHAVRRLYEEGKEAPLVTRNMPPVAGAIKWSRGLLVRLRRTWVRLQALNSDLQALEAGRRAANAITELSNDMLAYEKAHFAAWSALVAGAVTGGLRQPLLARQAPAGADGEGLAAASQAGGDTAAGVVAINFPAALLRMMREAKYLYQLGFAVPHMAVNLALQEGQIREHFQALGSMLRRHHGAITALRSAERALLREQAAELEAALKPGLTRINWTSLTITTFVAAVNKAVDQFMALVGQVQNNTAIIEKTIAQISRARLLLPDRALDRDATPAAGMAAADVHAGVAASPPVLGSQEDVPVLQEFVEDFEHHRQQVVEGLVARCRTVGPLLVKVEELVAGTATGKSPRLAGYYAYWERRLFSAVNSMVVAGLQALQARMQACSQQSVGVALSLIQSEVVVSPSTSEASKALHRLLHNLAESAKPFVRWMDGTCIEAPEQHVYGEDAEPFVFSFFADVSQSPAVIQAMRLAQQEVQRAIGGVARATARWRAYGVLWRGDREAALAKLRTRGLNAAAAELRMAQYHRVGQEAWAASSDQDLCFVRVRCAALAAAIRAEACAWVRGIAQVMAEADAGLLGTLSQQASASPDSRDAAALHEVIRAQAEDEAGVDRVRQAISDVQQAGPGALAACERLEDQACARLAYAALEDAAAVQAEVAAVLSARAAWQQLGAAAAEREAQGVEVQHGLPALGSQASAASLAEQASGRRSSLRRGSAMRTMSSASSIASLASRSKLSVRAPGKAAAAAPRG